MSFSKASLLSVFFTFLRSINHRFPSFRSFFCPSFFPVQPTDDRIMVAGFSTVINVAVERFEMVGTQNVVNAETETFLSVAETEATTALHKGVGESLGCCATDIGDGGIVEITAQNHRVVPMARYVIMEDVGLTRTLAHGRRQLANDHTGLGLRLFSVHIAVEHVIIPLAVDTR